MPLELYQFNSILDATTSLIFCFWVCGKIMGFFTDPFNKQAVSDYKIWIMLLTLKQTKNICLKFILVQQFEMFCKYLMQTINQSIIFVTGSLNGCLPVIFCNSLLKITLTANCFERFKSFKMKYIFKKSEIYPWF